MSLRPFVQQDLSEQIILSFDPEGVITRWSAAASRVLGYAPHQVIGHPWLSLLPAEEHAEAAAVLQRALAGEFVEDYPQPWLRADGRQIPLLLTLAPVTDSAGRVAGVNGSARERTPRLAASQHAELHLAAIVASSDDAIISKDLDGTITSWNAAATRIYGYTGEEAVGRSILLLIPPDLYAEEEEILAKLRRGERIEHFESRRQRKDGRQVEVSLTISPIRDHGGRIIGASKIARDITERKRAEEALRRAEKLAVAGRLAATVAHEINNPLAAITNLVYLLGHESGLSPQARERLEMIDSELTRVSGIARQTLGFYRDSSKPCEFSLSNIVEDVFALFSAKIQTMGITIRCDFRDPGRLNGYQGELRQVVSNLLANSLDACNPGGRISVRVRRGCRLRNGVPERGVRITVADDGSGIAPEFRDKLFEPFFTTKKDVGTGLGLWLSASLVAKHGGTIRVASSTRAGRSGTAMSIFLPHAQVAAEHAPQQTEERVQGTPGGTPADTLLPRAA